MAINKALIPAAGLGTRMKPLTDALPKELLPLGRRTALQHILSELAEAGISAAQIVSSPKKALMNAAVERLTALNQDLKISTAMQDPPLGLGHAVLQGEAFAAGEPILVALGDSLLSPNEAGSLSRACADLYLKEKADAVILFGEVPEADVSLYGIADPETDGPTFKLKGIIEKPAASDAPSRLAIFGRYILSPSIFDYLRRVVPDKKGEIQLTSAFEAMLRDGKTILGLRLDSSLRRYDLGSISGYYEAFVDFALSDESLGSGFESALKSAVQKRP